MDKEIFINSINEDMSLNPLTLSFNKNQAHLEKSYKASILLRSMKTNRLAIIFSIIAYSFFGILDAFVVPELKHFF